ncbi:MAG: pyridoxal phosphate-dependent aminotransferase [Granulosicoccus sp.]
MKFSRLTQRIREETHASDEQAIDPWAVHTMACERLSNGEDIVLLSIGQESNETTPELVVDSAVHSLRNGRHHYADVRGEKSLRSAIAAYHSHLTGQTADESQITVFSGAQNAMFAVAQVLLEPEDEVILVAPYYTTYRATFGASGAQVVTVTLQADNDYQLDETLLLQAVTDRTRAIVLNIPGNPLGGSYTRAQLSALVDNCYRRRIWLVLDTVYLDIFAPGTIALPHDLPGADNVLITIGSLSKSHRMTGWRVGWIAGPSELSTHLYNLNVCLHYGLPPFIMDAAAFALERSVETPSIVRAAIQSRREAALEHFTDISPVRLLDPGQGMFILLDVQALNTTAFEFAVSLLEAENIAVLPCNGFGPGGDYLARVGLCVDTETMRDACKRIKRFIEQWPAGS